MAAKTTGYRVFRALTPARLTAVRALITSMKANTVGVQHIEAVGRLAYGLTEQAIKIMYTMRNDKGQTRAQVGTWLEARLATALAEQARTNIKPGRTVPVSSFR
jgi:hypothetical protein